MLEVVGSEICKELLIILICCSSNCLYSIIVALHVQPIYEKDSSVDLVLKTVDTIISYHTSASGIRRT